MEFDGKYLVKAIKRAPMALAGGSMLLAACVSSEPGTSPQGIGIYEIPSLNQTFAERRVDLLSQMTSEYKYAHLTAMGRAELDTLDQINKKRQEMGLSRLTHDPVLSELAKLNSKAMVEDSAHDANMPNLDEVADWLQAINGKFSHLGRSAYGSYFKEDLSTEDLMGIFSFNPQANMYLADYTTFGIGHMQDGRGYHAYTILFTRSSD